MTPEKKQESISGNLMVIISVVLWGTTGVMTQHLYDICDISVGTFIMIKLLLTGIILLGYCFCKDQKQIFQVWSNKKDSIGMILITILGITGTQYSFFSAIHASDAPTATVLLYTYPVLVMIVTIIKNKSKPHLIEEICIFCAVIGTVMIATHGKITELAISFEALFWGLASSVGNCYFSVYSTELTHKYGSVLVNGWGMLIGGLFVFVADFKAMSWFHISFEVVLYLGVIIILGTMISFVLYLKGIQIIGAVRASVLGALEPFSALLVAVCFLNQHVVLADVAGMIGIIVSVLLPVIHCKKKAPTCAKL